MHYPVWARYEEHAAPVARGYWVHNLEHGGIVFLYKPGTPAATVEALRAAYRALPNDPACGHKRALLAADRRTLPGETTSPSTRRRTSCCNRAAPIRAPSATFVNAHDRPRPRAGLPGRHAAARAAPTCSQRGARARPAARRRPRRSPPGVLLVCAWLCSLARPASSPSTRRPPAQYDAQLARAARRTVGRAQNQTGREAFVVKGRSYLRRPTPALLRLPFAAAVERFPLKAGFVSVFLAAALGLWAGLRVGEEVSRQAGGAVRGGGRERARDRRSRSRSAV